MREAVHYAGPAGGCPAVFGLDTGYQVQLEARHKLRALRWAVRGSIVLGDAALDADATGLVLEVGYGYRLARTHTTHDLAARSTMMPTANDGAVAGRSAAALREQSMQALARRLEALLVRTRDGPCTA